MDWGYNPEHSLGQAQITSGQIDSAALSISSLTFGQAGAPGIPANTWMLLLQPEKQAIRWRDDGIAPTATVGYPIAAGSEFQYTGRADALAALQVIGQAAGAIVNIAAYGA